MISAVLVPVTLPVNLPVLVTPPCSHSTLQLKWTDDEMVMFATVFKLIQNCIRMRNFLSFFFIPFLHSTLLKMNLKLVDPHPEDLKLFSHQYDFLELIADLLYL